MKALSALLQGLYQRFVTASRPSFGPCGSYVSDLLRTYTGFKCVLCSSFRKWGLGCNLKVEELPLKLEGASGTLVKLNKLLTNMENSVVASLCGSHDSSCFFVGLDVDTVKCNGIK